MEMNRIVGMDSIKNTITEIVDKKDFYKRCNASPPHMLFAGLGSGNGCTTISNWITDMFYENNIRSFTALDLSLEFKPNGKTKESLETVFNTIDTASVYKNHYEGNIFINLDDIVPYANDSHVIDFISELSEICKYATLFFFIDVSKRNADILVDKIKSIIIDVCVVNVASYSIDEFVHITKQMIEEHGIVVSDDVDDIITNLITTRDIKSAKDCAYLKNELIRYANISNKVPTLSADEINAKVKC